jgi:hypothetical protein
MFGLLNNPLGCSPTLMMRGTLTSVNVPELVNALGRTNLSLLPWLSSLPEILVIRQDRRC